MTLSDLNLDFQVTPIFHAAYVINDTRRTSDYGLLISVILIEVERPWMTFSFMKWTQLAYAQ